MAARVVASHEDNFGPSFVASGITFYGMDSEDKMTHSFLGIPYAAPPVKKLRWKPPQALNELSNFREAKSFASACAQSGHIVSWYKDLIQEFGGDPETLSVPHFSEDCLYLNIWRPASVDEEDKVPIIFYIHGGSNEAGWSYEPNYLGHELAKKGVIVVTIGYRLGIFGFFPRRKSESANFGLLDQIAALRWVRTNISSVGGDPNNVTIMGESAGGDNVIYLMASPLARDLFQRVIIQSSGWALGANQSPDQYISLYTKILKQSYEMIEDLDTRLQEMSWKQVLELMHPYYEELGYQAIIDEHSLTKTVTRAFEEPEFRATDVLIGSNADEWKRYLSEKASFKEYVLKSFEGDIARKVVNYLSPYEDEHEPLDRLITAQQYVCPSLAIAKSALRRGKKSWVYYFTKVRSGKLAQSMGAYHGAELPYVFNTHDEWLPTSPEDIGLGNIMADYWTNFAKSGDPNGAGLPQWKRYSLDETSVQILDHPIRSTQHPSGTLCKLLFDAE